MKEENKDRLQSEWLVINALRENLSMVNDGKAIGYNAAISFAKENFGDLFNSKNSIIGQAPIIDSIYEKYKEEAEAISRDSLAGITAEDLIRKRIEEINGLIEKPRNKGKVKRLEKERNKLLDLLEEYSSPFTFLEEGQALLNEYDRKRIDFKYIKQIDGKYKIFKTKAGNPFVIRHFHPGKPEAATGVDLVYEYHKEGRVRIIAVQYKIWDGKNLYYSLADNLERQLNTAQKCFCNGGYCKGKRNTYRLPYCVPFLRPTDKLKNSESYFTSGWHIPICQIESRTEIPLKEKILRLSAIKDVALNTSEFEKLFDREMIGSRWFTVKEIEALYKKNKVLEPCDNSIFILSQRF